MTRSHLHPDPKRRRRPERNAVHVFQPPLLCIFTKQQAEALVCMLFDQKRTNAKKGMVSNMAIYSAAYKDRPAVVVESRGLKGTFLPEDGGKLTSLVTPSGRELLVQNPNPTYAVLTPTGSYADAECSGFDDMFPTIDPYTPTQGRYAGVTYPDHGEACRYPMEMERKTGSILLRGKSRLFAVTYEKEISPENDGSISVCYTFTNHSAEPFLYLWAAHCLLAGTPNGVVTSSFDQDAPAHMMFGPPNAEQYSRTQLGEAPSDTPAYKYYYLEPAAEGFCGYQYPSFREEFRLSYDPQKLPYLGVWLNNGGFKGLYCVALEPCTAPFDRPDTAAQKGCASVLPPNGSFSFVLKLALHKM